MATKQKYSLLLFYISLLWTTVSQYVDCPNTTNYAKCNGCYRASLYSVVCACDNYQMGILGICIYPPYPCYSTYLPYMYDPTYSEFNIWTQLVQPFWQKKLEEAKTNTSPPNPLPTYINNYDFKTMSDSYKRGWLIGYYLYQSFYSEISALSVQKQAQKLFQAVALSQTIFNYTILSKWTATNNFFNSLFATNYTVSQIINQIYDRIYKVVPCHDCYQFYGTLTGNLISSCLKCPPNCNICQNNTSQCTSCSSGFYLKDGLCQRCKVGGCMNCNQTNCLTCREEQSLKNNTCVPCETRGGCTTCLDEWPGSCTSCTLVAYSYFADQSGACYICEDPKCVVCYYDKTSCLLCSIGYYSNNQYVCKKCQENCDDCTSSITCISCRRGYGLINGICKPCQTAGCLTCDNNLALCSSCRTPYFQYNYNTGLCQLTSVTTLDQAQSISGETELCRPGCLLCYNNNTDLCFKCQQRYYMQNRYCKKCMPGCVWCDDANTCKLCIQGYVISESKCVRCPDNCRQCSSTNTSSCQDCRHGYYLVNNICKVSPIPECYIFDANQNQNCLVCLPGFTLNNDSKCIQCQMNCPWSCNPRNISQCTSSRYFLLYEQNFRYRFNQSGCNQDINGNCLAPEQAYELYNNSGTIATKRICNHPCSTCNSTYCFSCQPGYLYQKGKCSVDISCNPNCTKCLPGAQRNLNTNNCEACIENCGACLNGNCLECFDGFYKQGQTCIKCPSKCQSCYDSMNCATCAAGYIWPLQLYYYSYDCVKCHQNCLTCKFQPNLCLSCPVGKTLKYFNCLNQHHVAFQYRLNYQYSSFLSKSKSQVLIDELKTALSANFNDFFIYNISNGSTIFEGVYSASNSLSAISSYQTLKDYKLQGFEVIGSSFALMNDTQVVDCSSSGSSSCPQSSKLSTGAIAGIVIGSVGFAALVAGAVFLFVQSNKKEKQIKTNANIGQKVGESNLESKSTLKTGVELTETAKSIVKI